MNYEKEIEKVIDKNFNKVNREGVGFLTTEMNKCKTDMKDLVKNLLNIPIVSNNEVAVCTCKHPENQRKYYNDAPQFFCFACGSYVRTDC